uniref:Uncharacterized protein n=1 Tax=Pseudictyota dubia TaxID=2749911 RepID=A0A7R9W962_9STRA
MSTFHFHTIATVLKYLLVAYPSLSPSERLVPSSVVVRGLAGVVCSLLPPAMSCLAPGGRPRRWPGEQRTTTTKIRMRGDTGESRKNPHDRSSPAAAASERTPQFDQGVGENNGTEGLSAKNL